MLLTNFLPDGQLILKAIATDTSGQQTELGTATIVVDNANAVKPFGAIDSPAQGGDASGVKYRNNGWALTPQPNKIPESGATIQVFIDGVPLGNVGYNLYRSDIADFFPGYDSGDGGEPNRIGGKRSDFVSSGAGGPEWKTVSFIQIPQYASGCRSGWCCTLGERK